MTFPRKRTKREDRPFRGVSVVARRRIKHVSERNKSSKAWGNRNRSEHLVIHGSIASCGSWNGLSTVGGHGVVTSLCGREVVGHLSVELLDGLLLLAFTATAAAATATTTLAASLSSCGSGLVSSCRLGLVLLWLSIFVSRRPIERNDRKPT